MRAFYNICLRRHVESNLRASAFIRGFGTPWQVILTDASARMVFKNQWILPMIISKTRY
jgi:hypothetical protein